MDVCGGADVDGSCFVVGRNLYAGRVKRCLHGKVSRGILNAAESDVFVAGLSRLCWEEAVAGLWFQRILDSGSNRIGPRIAGMGAGECAFAIYRSDPRFGGDWCVFVPLDGGEEFCKIEETAVGNRKGRICVLVFLLGLLRVSRDLRICVPASRVLFLLEFGGVRQTGNGGRGWGGLSMRVLGLVSYKLRAQLEYKKSGGGSDEVGEVWRMSGNVRGVRTGRALWRSWRGRVIRGLWALGVGSLELAGWWSWWAGQRTSGGTQREPGCI